MEKPGLQGLEARLWIEEALRNVRAKDANFLESHLNDFNSPDPQVVASARMEHLACKRQLLMLVRLAGQHYAS